MFIPCGSAWRADPRLVQAPVHPPARAVRSRPFVSAGPFFRGSWRKPHVHCMWKRLAGRPAVGAGPSPPTCTRCKVPSFCIGRAFLPWIIRNRYGPQPEEKAARSLHVEAPGGPTRGGCRPKSTHLHAL